MFNKLFPQVFALAFILGACSESAKEQSHSTINTAFDSTKKEVVKGKTDAEILAQLIKDQDQTSQYYSFSSKRLILFKGKSGTKVQIDPQFLETESGNPLGDSIKVELKELLTTSDLASANAQTVSNGKLLSSDGAYFVQAYSGNEKLRLKKGRNFKLTFSSLPSPNMSLFKGRKDSVGNLNWELTQKEPWKRKKEKNAKSVPALRALPSIPDSNRILSLIRKAGTGNDSYELTEFLRFRGNREYRAFFPSVLYSRMYSYLEWFVKNEEEKYLVGGDVNRYFKQKDSIMRSRKFLIGDIKTFYRNPPKYPEIVSRSVLDTIAEAYASLDSAVAESLTKNFSSFGWINCDQFLNKSNSTRIQFLVGKSFISMEIFNYIVLMEEKCIATWSFPVRMEQNDFGYSLPIGSNAKIIAVGIKEGKVYYYARSLTISEGQKVFLDLKPTKMFNLKKLLAEK